MKTQTKLFYLCALAAFIFPLNSAFPDNASSAADRVNRAIAQTRQDIMESTSELTDLRKKQEQERKPLAAKLQSLHDEVAGLRTRADRIGRARRNNELKQTKLAEEIETIEEDL